MSEIRNLAPQNVWGYFDDICSIPHGSDNMDGINKYLVDFAKANELEYITDEVKNVIIIKEATPGYEEVPAVIMQAHVDMVCAKVADKEIDFLTEAITPYIDGAYVKADGTTLGADNGVGAAMMLAVLADKTLEHPRVEAVFTINEETSMEGAFNIDLSPLKGRRMLNLDSEEEGIFTVSSAGGMNIDTEYTIAREAFEGNTYKVLVHGGIGGHSGAEIHRGRSNANTVLGRALRYLAGKFDMRLVSIKGGKAHNVINNLAEAIVVAKAEYNDFDYELSQIEAIVRAEYSSTDPEITLDSEPAETSEVPMDAASTKTIIEFAYGAMDGIQYMSFDMEGLVETSMNFAVSVSEGDVYKTVTSVRSCVESRLDLVADKAILRAEAYGMKASTRGRYPGWQYAKESELRETCVRVWTELFGVIPEVVALHAGLECGIFIGKMPDLDAIAVGPNLFAVHSPDESVEIASVDKTYRFVCEVLKQK